MLRRLMCGLAPWMQAVCVTQYMRALGILLVEVRDDVGLIVVG